MCDDRTCAGMSDAASRRLPPSPQSTCSRVSSLRGCTCCQTTGKYATLSPQTDEALETTCKKPRRTPAANTDTVARRDSRPGVLLARSLRLFRGIRCSQPLASVPSHTGDGAADFSWSSSWRLGVRARLRPSSCQRRTQTAATLPCSSNRTFVGSEMSSTGLGDGRDLMPYVK
jgi:hypothetical protein